MQAACHPKSSKRCPFENICHRTDSKLWHMPDVLRRDFIEYPGGEDCPGRKAD